MTMLEATAAPPTQPYRVYVDWTDARIDRMKQLLGQGLSATAIAAAIGPNVTRNAVIGKVKRMGLNLQGPLSSTSRILAGRTPGDWRRSPAPAKSPRTYSSLKEAFGPSRFLRPEPLPEPIADTAIPFGQRRKLVDLTEFTCRWPVGDPGQDGFFFCGSQARDGSPYCTGHHRVAYHPARAR